jgi:pyruvate-formate lyase-activating enzyme
VCDNICRCRGCHNYRISSRHSERYERNEEKGVVKHVNKSRGELVITSTYEGNHGEGSLHYADDAIDMRKIEARPIDGEDKIKEKLGKDYDVVLERDHIHVEYDPKK